MVDFPKYAMNERVLRVADRMPGVVHNNYQFPNEPWKFVVVWDNGTQTTVEADELTHPDA